MHVIQVMKESSVSNLRQRQGVRAVKPWVLDILARQNLKFPVLRLLLFSLSPRSPSCNSVQLYELLSTYRELHLQVTC